MENNWDFVKYDRVKTINHFSNFVEGECNTIALALVKTIAAGKKMDFLNLLFLTGDISTGKTHLAESIINESSFNRNSSKRLYLSCETFIHNYISAVRENRVHNFINFYSEYDVLIIDDIHLLSNKDHTQQHFKEILNLYANEGKILVLTSNVLPNELEGFEEGIVSRLTKSVIVKLHKQTKRTKIEILEMKSKDYNVRVPYDILKFLSMDETKSIRAIEGDLITLIAKASVLRLELTYDFYLEQNLKMT